MLTTTCTILVLICITVIINQAHPHPRHNKALTDRQTIGATCQQAKPWRRTISPKGHAKAQQSFNISYLLFVSHLNNAITLVSKPWHSTWTTHNFFSKLIVVNKRWKKPRLPSITRAPTCQLVNSRQEPVCKVKEDSRGSTENADGKGTAQEIGGE